MNHSITPYKCIKTFLRTALMNSTYRKSSIFKNQVNKRKYTKTFAKSIRREVVFAPLLEIDFLSTHITCEFINKRKR